MELRAYISNSAQVRLMLLVWRYFENHQAKQYSHSKQLLDIEQITLYVGMGFLEAKWQPRLRRQVWIEIPAPPSISSMSFVSFSTSIYS